MSSNCSTQIVDANDTFVIDTLGLAAFITLFKLVYVRI
jgi:hypothetical protein